MEQSNNDREAFAQSIKTWNADHLARCLVATNVNEVAKDIIRAELQNRGVDLDKATARATKQYEAKQTALSRRKKLLVWTPTIVVICVIVVGIYLVSRP